MWRARTPLALHQDQRRRTKVHIAIVHLRYHASNSIDFFNMHVFISSSFRCLLQTVTISLHCCPITSPFSPLLCESIEEVILKLLWVHEAFGRSYWHFNFIFPPSFSAHRIRWAVVVSSCCEWVFYPGVIDYWATGVVPVCFSCSCLIVDDWTGRDLLHSSFEYPFSFHPSWRIYIQAWSWFHVALPIRIEQKVVVFFFNLI